jgi:hypothetical protein
MSHEEGIVTRASREFVEKLHDELDRHEKRSWVASRRENNPAQLTPTVEES